MSFSANWTFSGAWVDIERAANKLADKGGCKVRFDNFEGFRSCVFVLPKQELDEIVSRLDRSALDAVVGAEEIEENAYELAIAIDNAGELRVDSNEYDNSAAWEIACVLGRLLAQSLGGDVAPDIDDELFEMLSTVPKVAKG